MKKTVFITGATSGIGEACAVLFAEHGYNLIITGRRRQRLEKLKKKLESEYNSAVQALCFDIRKREDVFAVINSLSATWLEVDVLINNAGLALGRDSFDKSDLDDWDQMLQTNVNGLLYVSRAISPGMVKRKQGHIINIGSVAGKEVYENGNVYCASKFAVDAITKSMRIDLLKHGIKVTGIHPGAVETEFSLVRFKGDDNKASQAYVGFQPLTARNVAETVFYAASQPSHVCINELTITCLQQANTYYFRKD